MSEIPEYRKLHQKLRRQILTGEYEIGSLLPSENQLSKTFNLTRMTVRQALRELVKEGLIAKKAGKGSVVTSLRKTLGLLSFKGFSEVVGSTELQAKTIDLRPPYFTEWEQPFFYPLSDKELHQGCIRMERLRLVEEQAVMLEFTFIPNDDLNDIYEHALVNDSLFNTLQVHYHIGVNNVEQDIRAISAPAQISELLEVPLNTPLIHIYRKYSSSKPGFFIYSSLYCNTINYTIGNKF